MKIYICLKLIEHASLVHREGVECALVGIGV